LSEVIFQLQATEKSQSTLNIKKKTENKFSHFFFANKFVLMISRDLHVKTE